MHKPCPCHSGHNYQTCCKPFHEGALPATALELMRSRYSAYALHLADYIIQTTHPQGPHYHPNKQAWKEGILTFSRSTNFDNLEILEDTEENTTAIVTFIAHLTQKGKDVSFKEKSYFEKIDGRWLYHSGQISR